MWIFLKTFNIFYFAIIKLIYLYRSKLLYYLMQIFKKKFNIFLLCYYTTNIYRSKLFISFPAEFISSNEE